MVVPFAKPPAAACGFANQQHFDRLFWRAYRVDLIRLSRPNRSGICGDAPLLSCGDLCRDVDPSSDRQPGADGSVGQFARR